MYSIYKLSDLALYMECPLKWHYKTENSINDIYLSDSRMIVSSALRDTYIKHFQMVGSRRPWSVNLAAKFFSTRWDTYNKLIKSVSRSTRPLIDAHEKVLNIFDIIPEGFQVAAANYPTSRRIGQYIIESEIPAVLVKNDETVIILIDPSSKKESELDYAAQLTAVFNIGCFKRDVGFASTPTSAIIMNTYHGYSREIDMNRKAKINYPRIITRICQCLDDKVVYPRSGQDSCSHCVLSNTCDYKIGH